MPQYTHVDTPIVVFISSHQKEFQKLRYLLKESIDKVRLFNRYLMKAELVEKRGGLRIHGDISAALQNTTIFLGILGKKYSQTVEREYEEAKRRGLPLLIFEVQSPEPGMDLRETRLTSLVNRIKRVDDVRVTPITVRPSRASGRASLDPRYRASVEMMTQRLANVVADIAQQNLEVRKIVNPQ